MADVTVCVCLYRRSRYGIGLSLPRSSWTSIQLVDTSRLESFFGDRKPPRPTRVHVGEPHAKHGWLLPATSPESVRSIMPIDPQVQRSRTNRNLSRYRLCSLILHIVPCVSADMQSTIETMLMSHVISVFMCVLLALFSVSHSLIIPPCPNGLSIDNNVIGYIVMSIQHEFTSDHLTGNHGTQQEETQYIVSLQAKGQPPLPRLLYSNLMAFKAATIQIQLNAPQFKIYSSKSIRNKHSWTILFSDSFDQLLQTSFLWILPILNQNNQTLTRIWMQFWTTGTSMRSSSP